MSPANDYADKIFLPDLHRIHLDNLELFCFTVLTLNCFLFIVKYPFNKIKIALWAEKALGKSFEFMYMNTLLILVRQSH